MKDKIPPQAIDVEEVLLGAILIDGKSIDRVKSVINSEMFYNSEHGSLYKRLIDMHTQGKSIDIVTVKQSTDLQATFLSKLTSRVASSAHIKEHAAIIYDKWLAREMIKTGTEIIEKSYNEDIVDVIKSVRDSVEKKLLSVLGINSFGISLKDAGNKSLDEYYKREQMIKQGKRSGIPSSLNALDTYTAGWQPEQLIVLAARPGMGKTSMAINFLMRAASVEKSVAMFSLEMSAVKLTDKIICSAANISLSDYKKGKLTNEDRIKAEESIDLLSAWKVNFNDNLLTDIDQIYASAQAIKSRSGLDMIIIDYLQLMKGSGNANNREREVAENSRKAKIMAVELGCPVILLSQLNRGLESRGDKRPMLSDLRESGAIEQDADIVLFLYRDAVYNSEADQSKGEIIIAKHREGPTGIVDFYHNETLTRFSDKQDFNNELPF